MKTKFTSVALVLLLAVSALAQGPAKSATGSWCVTSNAVQ